MHVLYLHQYFAPPDGAGGNRSLGMASRLVKAGHRVTMLTSSAYFPAHYGMKPGLNTLEVEGIQVRAIWVPYSNQLSYAARIWAFVSFAVRACFEAARVKDVDVVFATSTPLTIAVPAVWAKRRLGKPMVFEVRDLWPELPIAIGALRSPPLIWAARALERFAYRNADRLVALSPGMREGILKHVDRPVAVIPNNSDLAQFRVPASEGEAFLAQHPYLRGGPLVAYTGTLGAINGVEYLAEVAAAMLPLDPATRFVIVGGGKMREKVRARAAELGVLEKNLWMLPAQLKRDMPRVLSASTVAVSLFIDLPEMWHNSANKFFDALAAGRPVMINYQGWQADLIRETGAGLVVPARDAAAAAKLLHGFLEDKRALDAGAAASAALAMGRFDRDKLFQDFRRVLEEAAEAQA